MNWIQLRLTVEQSFVAELEGLVFENHALSVTCLDAKNQPILEPGVGETPLWSTVLMVVLFEGAIDKKETMKTLQQHSSWSQVASCSWELLEDKEWVRAWMDDFHPMQFGKRLWICPNWEKPPQQDAVNIFLDPGLAFGTGTHPTTSLCLQWLDENIQSGQQLIDYGCGSGILAIAAIKLGASSVLAIDYDPQALLATRENATRNGIENNQLNVVLPEDAEFFKADGILANILAETLIELGGFLAEQVIKDGWIALSGILEHQAESLVVLYSQWFNMNEPVIMDEWVLLTGIRK